ncbi:uncharacterized protein LOC105009885 [Esox lucius]|uniref:uncharacterized protein LOC105009885 n=1 Tax=Esox lucius TaxID=8010 RepID=UPI00147738E1|nr:uncharacterized protein LOC105009885 [Esox lucius]
MWSLVSMLYGKEEEGTSDSKTSVSVEGEEETSDSKTNVSGEGAEGTSDFETLCLCVENNPHTESLGAHMERPDSPVPSCLSMNSEHSMGRPLYFREEDSSAEQVHQEKPDSPVPNSKGQSLYIRNKDSPEQGKDQNVKIRGPTVLRVQQEVRNKLKLKHEMLYDEIGCPGHQIFLKDIYTDLYITEGGSVGVNKEHEVRRIEMASKRQTTQDTPINCNNIFRTVKHHQKRDLKPNLLLMKPTSKSLDHEDMF